MKKYVYTFLPQLNDSIEFIKVYIACMRTFAKPSTSGSKDGKQSINIIRKYKKKHVQRYKSLMPYYIMNKLFNIIIVYN